MKFSDSSRRKNLEKEIATTQLLSLFHKYSIHKIEMSDDLLIQAGTLKCQHRTTLSYIDCLSIAASLKLKIPFHTTEKLLKNIHQNMLDKLVVVKYLF